MTSTTGPIRISCRTDPASPVAETGRLVHLTGADTSVLLRISPEDFPSVLHWGANLGPIENGMEQALELLHMPGPDEPIWPHSWASVLPRQTAGWLGRPGLRGQRPGGAAWELTYTEVTHTLDSPFARQPDAAPAIPSGNRLRSTATDERAQIEVTTDLRVTEHGLLVVGVEVSNLGSESYEITMLEPAVAVPYDADELMDFGGGPTHEREPQRRAFDQGQWVREAWAGRPGHDFPTMLAAGQHGFGFRSGRVWGVHLAWSGNQVLSAERSYTGWRLLRAGELLAPGELRLAPGEKHAAPPMIASWGAGLDELTEKIHHHVRAQRHYPDRSRPVVMNTWEAVRFDLSQDKLLELAETAAQIGVERFVLDDGWFRGRRDDTRGLGDWTVDPTVFPDGLEPLAKTVRSLGMEFGLWIEPEMINIDSDLARAHPDWILGTHAGPGLPSRHQHVLDLANPHAWRHVFEDISTLITDHDIACLKWDHNRPATATGRGPTLSPAIHQQTHAVYRLMDRLLEQHPGLEIEACAGGGARLDLGVLSYASRTWPSDTIDPHERHRIVRWTNLTVPLEMIGAHIGSSPDHSTHRRHPLDFRASTAVWGHMGIECDITELPPEDLQRLRVWIEYYKSRRDLLHSGTAVRGDRLNPVLQLDGVVARDRREAIYRVSCLDHSTQFPPGRITLPGLNPESSYQISADGPTTPGFWSTRSPWSGDPAIANGRFLSEVGMQAPQMDPDTTVLIYAEEQR